MKWDIYKAKAWMLQVGMDLIEGGLYAEGGAMIYESKWGNGGDSKKKFRRTIKDICWWDVEDINDAVQEIGN
jgi:hypothetical protein